MVVRLRRLVALCAVLGALTACGGGDDSGGEDSGGGATTSTIPLPDAWDPDGVEVAEGLAGKVEAADLGCGDFAPLDIVQYAGGAQRGGFALPDAVGNCQIVPLEPGVEGEDAEFSVFADADAAQQWMEKRLGYLCEEGRQANVGLPGYPMVVGDRWTVQPDTETAGRRLAPVLGGEFRYQQCEDRGGWDDESADRLESIAASLVSGGVGCGDFLVQDKDYIAGQFASLGLPVPGAVGDCTVGSGKLELLASLTGEDLTATLELREVTDCTAQRVSGADLPAYVVGDLWAGRAPGVRTARQVAAATGAELRLVDCAEIGA